MLVLTRKIGEEIIIAGNIRISVVDVGAGRVKIGVVAPRSITVDRAEIHDKKNEVPEPVLVEIPDIHNRIAETLLSQDSPMKLENRLAKHHARLPKKPR